MPAFAAPPGTPIAWWIRCKPGPGGDTAIRYERHEPEKTLLHRVVREELEPFVERSRLAGAAVAGFVEREIRAYLECGSSTSAPSLNTMKTSAGVRLSSARDRARCFRKGEGKAFE